MRNMPRNMMRNALTSLALLLCLPAAVFSTGSKTKRALLIGLDGVRPDALAIANTPNIDALIAAGAFTDTADILGERYRKNDTISGPGWGSILSGVWADKHGVPDNKHFEKYRDWPTMFSHIKAAQPDAYTAAIVTWKPLADHLARDASTIDRVEPKNKDYAAGDTEVSKRAQKLLSEKNSTVLFVYFGGCEKMKEETQEIISVTRNGKRLDGPER